MKRHIERYIRTNLRITSDQTSKLIWIAYRQFGTFLGRSPQLADLCDDEIAGFISWLVKNGRAATTANQKRNYLCAFWRWCHRRRLVDAYPSVGCLAEPEPISRAWTVCELAQLFAAIQDTEGEFAGIPRCDFYEAYHRVLLDTGERKGAILESRWDWYLLDQRLLQVPAVARKGRRKNAAYQLRHKTVASLRAIRMPKRDLVFPWPLSSTSWDNHYRQLLERAGLPTDGKHSQRMRRTHASHLAANGGNATRSLQHSRRAITERYYLDSRIVRPDTDVDLLPDV